MYFDICQLKHTIVTSIKILVNGKVKQLHLSHKEGNIYIKKKKMILPSLCDYLISIIMYIS